MTSVVLPNDVLFSRVETFLKEGREVIIKTKGNSMLPFVQGDKDSVVLKKSDELNIGDIVLVHLGGHYVMHRIISQSEDMFTMMGDGNIRGTESFRKDDVLGKVIWIIKNNGKKVKPGKARLWKALLPIRRYLLAIYRRII